MLKKLKIKDNVDLKELEKFGFENQIALGFLQKDNGYLTYFIDRNTKTIEVMTYDDNEVVLDDTLYDLIQAGLVEKIDT